jgi:hypothetical protein
MKNMVTGKMRVEQEEDYRVVNWQRLTLEEYNEFKGKVG